MKYGIIPLVFKYKFCLSISDWSVLVCKVLYTLLVLASLLISNKVTAQDSLGLSFSGYAEVYYAFDFSKPANHEKPFFLYNHKRHNEVNINLAFAKANYTSSNMRANLAFMTGNYAQYNLASEPTPLRFVFEANAGVKLSRQHNLWLDAGIMPSHIGFESALSADCWTLSRSMVAENSPYYETGVKITAANKKETLQVAGLFLNGWQHIQRPNYQNKPSGGAQVTYKPNANFTLNYSNFIGSEKPDSLKAIRIYHNVYGIFQLSHKWGLITSFDLGRDKKNETQYAFWYAPVFIIRRTLNTTSGLAVRGELFHDRNQVLLVTDLPHGFQTYGLSLNYDYAITPKALARLEGRSFFSKDNIFNYNRSNTNFSVLAAFSVKL